MKKRSNKPIDLAQKEVIEVLKKYKCRMSSDDYDNILIICNGEVKCMGRPDIGYFGDVEKLNVWPDVGYFGPE